MRISRPMPHISMPTNGSALSSLAKHLPNDLDSFADGVRKAGKQVGRTGKRLGEIASDIQQAGETTERVGKLLSK
ncbi:MAG: hypothetical protein JOZ98_17265 [Solirubrobacterales bacterium]|nr:hypothetical protein [Solirubrobacterales bacterium]MBV9796521.1 hypothetical protein [Solirubrobacterales bacterium]